MLKKVLFQSSWLVAEWRRLLKRRFTRIALLAVLVLPLIYGGLYLWAFWDPYGKIEQLPVALVNLDHCAWDADAGLQQCFGQQVVDTLLANPPLHLQVVDETEAATGLQQHRFYTVVTIPSDFSQKLLTANSAAPQKTALEFQSRQATNFMAYKLTESAFERIKAALNASLGEKYIQAIFTQTRNSLPELVTASTGSYELWQGLQTAQVGTQHLVEADQQFVAHLGELRSGLNDLSNGMLDFRRGMSEIQPDETVSFNDGIDQAATGSQTLASNLGMLQTATRQLASGSGQLVAGNQQLTSAASQVQQALVQANQVLQQYFLAHPEASQAAELQGVQHILAQTQTGQTQLVAGLQQMQVSAQQAASASQQVSQATLTLSEGAGQLASGLHEIKKGKDDLWSASEQLRAGLFQATHGSNELVRGAEDLTQGQQTLLGGLQQAATGSAELYQGLSTAVTTTRQATQPQKTDLQAAMMSEPIGLDDISYDVVTNNGTGFAPYFIPLALWVGAMAVFFVEEMNEKESLSWRKYFQKLEVWLTVVSGQALILASVLHFCLGLQVVDLLHYYLLTWLLAQCFLLLQLALNMAFGLAGKFLAIVILMLQLTSCGGTYPLETVTPFFRQVSRFLPMTYATNALREAISGNDQVFLLQQAKVVIYITIAMLCINCLLVAIKSYAHHRH